MAGVLLLVTGALSGCGDGSSPTGGKNNFTISLSLSGATLTVQQEESGTVTTTIERGGGYTGAVSLAVEGAPTGVSATADPYTVSSGTTSTLTLTVGASASPGTYPLTVRATGADVTDAEATLNLIVTEKPGFSLALSPADLGIRQGESGTATVTITRVGGFSGAVALSVGGLPSGVTVSPDPASTTGDTSTLTVVVQATATAPRFYFLGVTGTAEGLADQIVPLGLSVAQAPSPSFSLGLDPSSLSVAQGGTGTSTIHIGRDGGFAGEVALTVTGAPAGVTATTEPAATTGTASTLTVAVGASVAPGTYSMTVTGSASGLTDQTTAIALTVTASGGGQDVTWTFCEETGTPLWFAVQDGSGPWTRVVGVNDTYTVHLSSDKAGIAYVTQGVFGEFRTSLFYVTSAGLGILGESQCDFPGGPSRTVHGSVAGLSPSDQATVTLGGAHASVLGTLWHTFTLQNVAQGIQDLFAARWATTVADGVPVQTLDKLLFRRGLNPSNGSTLQALDFGGAEAFFPATQNLSIDNLGTDEATVGLSYFTGHGASASLFSGPATGASQTFPAVPGARQETGDLHILSVTAAPAGAAHMREVTSMFHEAADQTITLGPELGTVVVSKVANAPYLRLRAQYTIQSEYDEVWVLNLDRVPRNNVSVFVTAGYLGDGATFDQTVPDFSGVAGWQHTWGMTSGASISWSLSATGWTSSGGVITSPYAEGEMVMSAARSGTINP